MSGKDTKSEFFNLTPFVDLFSTLVIFLLMTAVWTQISALSTNAENTTSAATPPPEPPVKKVQLAANIFLDRVEFREDEEAVAVPHIAGAVDTQKVGELLSRWRVKYPDRKDIILNTANEVPYNMMIRLFDTMVGSDWPDVGVNTL